MGVNQLFVGGVKKFDISDSTLTAADLLEGLVAYNAEGERIIGEMAQIIVDDHLSTSSTNPVQNKVINGVVTELDGRVTALEGASSSQFASMFSIGLADSYFVNTEEEAPAVISNALNLDGFVVPIGNSGIVWKKPTVIVPPIQWSTTVDEDYNYTGTVDVKVQFGEAGYITKTILFKRPGEGKIYACRLEDVTGFVDTGIAGRYEYTHKSTGHTIGTNQCVLVSAFVSTTARTEARVMGSSKKWQCMWAANKELLASTAGVNVAKMYDFVCKTNYAKVVQGAVEYETAFSGHIDTGDVGQTITLLGSRANNQLGNGVLSSAEILDGSGISLAKFEPYKIVGDEVVILNVTGLTAQQIFDIVQNGDASAYAAGHILRPTIGTLLEVTTEEDALL